MCTDGAIVFRSLLIQLHPLIHTHRSDIGIDNLLLFPTRLNRLRYRYIILIIVSINRIITYGTTLEKDLQNGIHVCILLLNGTCQTINAAIVIVVIIIIVINFFTSQTCKRTCLITSLTTTLIFQLNSHVLDRITTVHISVIIKSIFIQVISCSHGIIIIASIAEISTEIFSAIIFRETTTEFLTCCKAHTTLFGCRLCTRYFFDTCDLSQTFDRLLEFFPDLILLFDDLLTLLIILLERHTTLIEIFLIQSLFSLRHIRIFRHHDSFFILLIGLLRFLDQFGISSFQRIRTSFHRDQFPKHIPIQTIFQKHLHRIETNRMVQDLNNFRRSTFIVCQSGDQLFTFVTKELFKHEVCFFDIDGFCIRGSRIIGNQIIQFRVEAIDLFRSYRFISHKRFPPED